MLTKLIEEIQTILNTLKINWKISSHTKNVSVQFTIKNFGVIIYGYHQSFASEIKQSIDSKHKGWRHIYISNEDDMVSVKENLIWNLMKSGYMRFIRESYQSQFNNIIVEQLGDKIIRERLRLWNDDPMYKFFIDENKDALTIPKSRILSHDPAFFDYMPEINR
jgi:hypothetical protein